MVKKEVKEEDLKKVEVMVEPHSILEEAPGLGMVVDVDAEKVEQVSDQDKDEQESDQGKKKESPPEKKEKPKKKRKKKKRAITKQSLPEEEKAKRLRKADKIPGLIFQ